MIAICLNRLNQGYSFVVGYHFHLEAYTRWGEVIPRTQRRATSWTCVNHSAVKEVCKSWRAGLNQKNCTDVETPRGTQNPPSEPPPSTLMYYCSIGSQDWGQAREWCPVEWCLTQINVSHLLWISEKPFRLLSLIIIAHFLDANLVPRVFANGIDFVWTCVNIGDGWWSCDEPSDCRAGTPGE